MAQYCIHEENLNSAYIMSYHMIASETIQVNIRMPESLVAKIDEAVRRRSYRNRQELILEAVREKLEEGKVIE